VIYLSKMLLLPVLHIDWKLFTWKLFLWTLVKRNLCEYHITGNFCGFGLKRRHLIFADFFFCGLKISAPKKKIVCITGSNNWSDATINNRCTLQWSLEVKTYLALWKVFKGYSFWICIWLTSNLAFHLFRDLFCWQEIRSQQLDRYR